MLSRTLRALLVGVSIALLLVAGLVALLATGEISLPTPSNPFPSRFLVIATVDEQDTRLAEFAFEIVDGQRPVSLDTTHEVVVSGTSAKTARDAYPYVGGEGVARALGEQVGRSAPDWIVLPPRVWTDLVDEAGGITVDIPVTISAYDDEYGLIVLREGRRTLSGDEVNALAASMSFFDDTNQRAQVREQLNDGMGEVIAGQSGAALAAQCGSSGVECSSRIEKAIR